MHDGEVGGFKNLRRQILAELSEVSFQAIGGSTDSEHLFAMFLDQITRFGRHPGVQNMVEALRETIRQLLAITKASDFDEPSYLKRFAPDEHTT